MSRAVEVINKAYDEAVLQTLKALWDLVKEDGCVMANPNDKGDGWVVYVQYGEAAVEYEGPTLFLAARRALFEEGRKH